jgi:hypothetical protein
VIQISSYRRLLEIIIHTYRYVVESDRNQFKQGVKRHLILDVVSRDSSCILDSNLLRTNIKRV